MKRCFLTERGPRAIGPYSSAVLQGGLCYLSGVIPVDPETGALASAEIGGQARQVFENMKAMLEELGLSMADVLKTTVFMTDLSAFGEVNEIYATYFGPDYPARSCVQVSALPKGAQIEAEAVVAAE